MTLKEWNALKRMTQGGTFESNMSVGLVKLIPQEDESFVLQYPSYDVHLYVDKDIDNHDRHYLRYMYLEAIMTQQLTDEIYRVSVCL